MNSYEQKQVARKKRLESLAEKNNTASNSCFDVANEMNKKIPLGQPLLKDHHSYQGDLNYRNKIDARMSAGVDAQNKAEFFKNKADSVGMGGISSDDENAVGKLMAEMNQVVTRNEDKKRLGKEYKRAGFKIENMQIDDDLREKLTLSKKDYFLGENKWVPGDYLGARLGDTAKIRRLKNRISTLKAAAKMEERPDIEGDGWTIKEDKAINRILICFVGKPSYDTRQILKQSGWKWNRTAVAWTRMLNNAGRNSAIHVTDQIENGVKQ